MPHSQDVRVRMARVTAYLLYGGRITSEVLREKFACSKATAKRVMLDLEMTFPELSVSHEPQGQGGGTRRVLSMPDEFRARVLRVA